MYRSKDLYLCGRVQAVLIKEGQQLWPQAKLLKGGGCRNYAGPLRYG